MEQEFLQALQVRTGRDISILACSILISWIWSTEVSVLFNLKWGFVFVDEQAFYYEGKAIMSNEEFDNLKEELMWEGSTVVMLSILLLYMWLAISFTDSC